MRVDLQDKIAVVTGGSSGIGLETARLLLDCGARVAICGRDAARLETARTELVSRSADDRVLAVTCDVLNGDDLTAFADAVADTFGGLDILVNNAGKGRLSTFAATTDQDWTEELELKFFGVIRPTRAFLPLLERSSAGAIVCVNALLALQPEPHMVATSAARAGLLNLTRSLAGEFAPKGIRVNSILLGLVDSGQWRRRYEAAPEAATQSYDDWAAKLAASKGIPLGRLGHPAEAARAIVFLASPAASYTTGASIDVSGGLARHVG